MSWYCSVLMVGYNLNPVIHLVFRLVITPEHDSVHISTVMTLDFSYFVIKTPLSNCSCMKQTRISTCLTLGVTIFYSTTEIQLVLSS